MRLGTPRTAAVAEFPPEIGYTLSVMRLILSRQKGRDLTAVIEAALTFGTSKGPN